MNDLLTKELEEVIAKTKAEERRLWDEHIAAEKELNKSSPKERYDSTLERWSNIHRRLEALTNLLKDTP